MNLKAKKISDTVVPFEIYVSGANTTDPKPGVDYFVAHLRHITRAHLREMTQAAAVKRLNPQTRAMEDTTDNDKLGEIYCEAVLCQWEHMTPTVVHRMVELEDGAELPATNGNGAIPFNRELAKFLWDNADAMSFQGQIMRYAERVLEAAEREREVRAGNSGA